MQYETNMALWMNNIASRGKKQFHAVQISCMGIIIKDWFECKTKMNLVGGSKRHQRFRKCDGHLIDFVAFRYSK